VHGGDLHHPAVDAVLAAAARLIGMEAVFVAGLTDDEFSFLRVCGELPGVEEGARFPRADSFCHRLLAGAPTSTADAGDDPAYTDTPVRTTLGIRSYVGVPVRDGQGRVVGTLCGVDRQSVPVTEHAQEILAGLARAIEAHIDDDARMVLRRTESGWRVGGDTEDDVTAAMVLGESWIEVPEAIAVEYAGELSFGIGGKDVILETLGALGRNTVAMERSVEYRVEHPADFSTDVRFTIANMTAEFGGLNGIFEADEVTATWLAGRADEDDPQATQPMRTFRADPDAPYAQKFQVDLASLEPQVAVPFSPDNVRGVSALAGTELQGLFIGACTTTEEELVLAALVLEAAGVSRPGNDKQIVVPGDLTIQEDLRRAGLWSVYERAGFRKTGGVAPVPSTSTSARSRVRSRACTASSSAIQVSQCARIWSPSRSRPRTRRRSRGTSTHTRVVMASS